MNLVCFWNQTKPEFKLVQNISHIWNQHMHKISAFGILKKLYYFSNFLNFKVQCNTSAILSYTFKDTSSITKGSTFNKVHMAAVNVLGQTCHLAATEFKIPYSFKKLRVHNRWSGFCIYCPYLYWMYVWAYSRRHTKTWLQNSMRPAGKKFWN